MPLPSWLRAVAAWARARAPVVAAAGLVGLVVRSAEPTPPERSVEGVAASLGDAIHGQVRSDDFVWEQRGGVLFDAFVGRRVLFLGRTSPDAPRDLYRARVRLTRSGRGIAVRTPRNLSKSPAGDEHDLVARGKRVVYVTDAFGGVAGVTLLDLSGDHVGDPSANPPAEPLRSVRLDPSVRRGTWFDRAVRAVANWRGTDSVAGIGRVEITFAQPIAEVRADLDDDHLVLALGPDRIGAMVDCDSLALDARGGDAFGARVRRVSGPRPRTSEVAAEIAESAFDFNAGVAVRKLAVRFDETMARRPPVDSSAAEGVPIPSGGDFPPPLPGVTWNAPPADALPPGPTGIPPLFAQATVHDGVGNLVQLVALDMRRLDLGIEAGEGERSQAGLHGVGRVPESPDRPVVAAFALGVASANDLGLVVERTTLVAPRAGLSTLGATPLGDARFGAWPLPATLGVTSLAQFVQPLFGTTGPELEKDRTRTPRSALCLLGSGHLVYAWGGHIDVAALKGALTALRCELAVPLATGAEEGGFVYLADGAAHPVNTGMTFSSNGLETGYRSSFAFVRTRTTTPPGHAPAGGWSVDPATQPAPTFLPAMFIARVVDLGAQVHLTSFAPGRFGWRIRAGTREVGHRFGAAFAKNLDEAERGAVLAQIGLGTARRKNPRGLATDGSMGLLFRPEAAVLAVRRDAVRVVPSDGFEAAAGEDATELPMTANEGKPLAAAGAVGTMRARGALCVQADGTVVVATTTFDTDEPATEALLDVGCTRVVALDRGAHQGAFVKRAGSETPPETKSEVTTLYAIGTPMRGRASRVP